MKKKSRIFSLYILDDLYKRVQKLAAKERLSMAWLINEAISEYLKKKKV